MPFFHTVILIDDDPTVSYLAEYHLKERQLHHNFLAFRSVGQALKFLQHYTPDSSEETLPDLILLDVNMPGEDGFDFLDHWQAHPRLFQKRTFVFLQTTSATGRDVDRARRYPIDGYLGKPFSAASIEQILTIVSEL